MDNGRSIRPKPKRLAPGMETRGSATTREGEEMRTEVGKHNGIKYLLFRDRIGNQQGHSYKGNPWKWFLYAGTNSHNGEYYVGDFDKKRDAIDELDARSQPSHPYHPNW